MVVFLWEIIASVVTILRWIILLLLVVSVVVIALVILFRSVSSPGVEHIVHVTDCTIVKLIIILDGISGYIVPWFTVVQWFLIIVADWLAIVGIILVVVAIGVFLTVSVSALV